MSVSWTTHLGASPFSDWQAPFTLGQEIAGWVAECGRGVYGLSAGQPVVLLATHPDGTCGHCRRGQDNNGSAASAGRGYGRDGGLAPSVLVPDTGHSSVCSSSTDLGAGGLGSFRRAAAAGLEPGNTRGRPEAGAPRVRP
jgi:D-arabinose 1-dehydrogenase-like Zn-dependent alcohol dehydrogenase